MTWLALPSCSELEPADSAMPPRKRISLMVVRCSLFIGGFCFGDGETPTPGCSLAGDGEIACQCQSGLEMDYAADVEDDGRVGVACGFAE